MGLKLRSPVDSLLYCLLKVFVRRILNRAVPELDILCFTLDVTDEDDNTGASSDVYTLQQLNGDLVTTMKLNYEATDRCTEIAVRQACQFDSRRDRQLYLIAAVTFGSHRFYECFDKCYASFGGHPTLDIVMERLVRSERYSSEELFSRAFNPCRIWFNEARKSGSPRKIVMKHWLKQKRKLDGCFRIRSDTEHCRSKQAVQQQLGRTFGHFLGKNYFSFWRRVERNLPKATPALFWPDCPESQRFTLTGPGARTALNLLMGWPHLDDKCTAKVGHAVRYNTALLQFFKVFRTRTMKRFAAEFPDIWEEVSGHFHKKNFDEHDFQFLLCELSKIIRFVQTGNKTYLRSYWKEPAASMEDFFKDWDDFWTVPEADADFLYGESQDDSTCNAECEAFWAALGV